jgi:4-hydroxythreonine-4-phosphate dehydrogenase
VTAPLALTPGEPAGIGPDLTVAWAQRARRVALVAVADPDVLEARAAKLGLPLAIDFDLSRPSCGAGSLTVQPVSCAAAVRPGELDARNARYVLETLTTAVDGCLAGRFAGLVTGPVQKSVINDAGIAFTGHTEFLAQHCCSPQVVMLLVAGTLRVALATTHVPLSAVPGLITRARLSAVLDVLIGDLERRFRLPSPKVVVAGLNPHAGEGGHLGREEIDVIAPVCQAYATRGVSGPFPADTLFTPARLRGVDAVLAMYHDQGLPVLKHVGFGEAVNVTLGLSIVRTSVDHGTALDVAGTGRADLGSLEAAIDLAASLTVR